MAEATDNSSNTPLSGDLLFYSNPEPLSSTAHGKIGLRRIARPFAFAAGSHIVPLNVTEFRAAAICFPIIFAGEQYQPLAVMGVNPGANLFLRPDGLFEPGVYVPAYIRRYPFVLANDASREQMVVCIDRGAEMLGELPDLAFFDSAGQPTDYTKGCIQFCNDFEVEVRRTQSFVALMKDLDLFETKTASFTPGNPDGTPAGPPQNVAEYFAISEEKVQALSPDKLKELVANGALPQIYAHLTSLVGWDRLIALTFAAQAQAQGQAPANLN
jgi:hypothetical protein